MSCNNFGCGNSGGCLWLIIILILLFCCCGNNGLGCGNVGGCGGWDNACNPDGCAC